MDQEGQKNIVRLPSILDFFKSNIPFEDKLIEEDLNIICSSIIDLGINLKDELIKNNLWDTAKESIVEISIIFSGALELSDSDYEDVKKEILEKSKHESMLIRRVRKFLMKSDPDDTKAILIGLLRRECLKDDGHLDEDLFSAEKIKFESRISGFENCFCKQKMED